MQKQLGQLEWRSIVSQINRSAGRRCSDGPCSSKYLFHSESARHNSAARDACSDDSRTMKQQHTLQLAPPGRRPSLWERQDQRQYDISHHLQQQEGCQQEEVVEQQQEFLQHHSGHHQEEEQREGLGEIAQKSSIPQRHTHVVDACRKKEEIQKTHRRAARGQGGTSATSFLRALWPGLRDTGATEEKNPKEETSGKDRCSTSRQEAHDTNTTVISNEKLAAFFSPPDTQGTEHKRSTPGRRRLVSSSTSLSSYSAASEASSSASSRRLGWSAAGLSAGGGAPLPFKPFSLFAGWLPTSMSSASSSAPHGGPPSQSDVYVQSASSANTKALKKPWVPADDSEAPTWLAGNKVSSSDRMKKSLTTRGGKSSSRQAAPVGWTGDIPVAYASERLKTGVSTGADHLPQRDDLAGACAFDRLRPVAYHLTQSRQYQEGRSESSIIDADQRESAADEGSVLDASTALVQAERNDREAGSGGGATAFDSRATREDSTSGYRDERGETGKTSNAAAIRRHMLEENKLWEQHHTALGSRMDECVVHENRDQVTALARRDITTATGGRRRGRDTKLQQRKRELAGGGSSQGQFLFNLHGTRNIRHYRMSQEPQRQATREGQPAPAATKVCTGDTRGEISKEKKMKDNAEETGKGGEGESSSMSFSWMDQLRKVLRQTSLLGGHSGSTAKKSRSRQSGVCTPVTTSEETGTEEELSDSELLLFQGISTAKLSEDALQHAAHGSEPCNVLVCVEPAAAATVPSSSPVAAAAAIGDGTKAGAMATQAGVVTAEPCSSRSAEGDISSAQSSTEQFSGVWETTPFIPSSFASLAAAVNLRPWMAAHASAPLSSDAPRGNYNATSNSSSDQGLTMTGKAPSDRSMCDSNSSTISSQDGAAAVEEEDMSTREDFETLFARCRSGVNTGRVSPAALPLHGVAVVRADGSTKTYWRVPALLQHDQERLEQQQQQQQGKQREHQSSNEQEKQKPEQEKCQKHVKRDGETASCVAAVDLREKDEGDWMFIPLQQPTAGAAKQPQHSETQQQQQARGVRQGEEQERDMRKKAQPIQNLTTEGGVQPQCGSRQPQQLHDDVPDACINSNGSSSRLSDSNSTAENHISQGDAWSTSAFAGESSAAAAPPGSSSMDVRDSSTGKTSRSREGNNSHREGIQESSKIEKDNFGCPLRDREDTASRQLLQQQQQPLQPQQDEKKAKTCTVRQKGSEETGGVTFLRANGKSTSAGRGARSWAQYNYNNASQRRNRGMLEIEDHDNMYSDERQSGSTAATDHRLRTRRASSNRGEAESTDDISPAEKAAAAALGTAGAASATAKKPEESSIQQQPTGWWSEFSKGVAEFFTQQQGALLPDGASAGSLAAVAVGLNLSAAAVMSSVEHVNKDLKERGTAQRLGKRLRKELNKLLPEDCAVLLGKRPGKVTVTYTHVVPFYASTVRVSSAAQDCINPDLQVHDEQILHYLRAKALLRARARLLREQRHEQQQLQQDDAAQPHEAAEEGNVMRKQQQQQQSQKRRVSTSTLASDNGSLRDNNRLSLLPSICPLHKLGRDGKKHQHGVAPPTAGTHTKLQSSADSESSRSTVRPIDKSDLSGDNSHADASTSLASRRADAAAGARKLTVGDEQHERRNAAASPSSAIVSGKENREAGTLCAETSLLLSPTARSSNQNAVHVSIPGSFPCVCNVDACASCRDGRSIPPAAEHPSCSSSPSYSTDAMPLSAEISSAPGATAHSVAVDSLQYGGAFPAAAVALPAAAAAAAEVAAQVGEKVCAFESIYACPVCSPLGEICPPHHFSYYYHDPNSAAFGSGAITTSASFNAEHAAPAGSIDVPGAPPAYASTAITRNTATAGSPPVAAAPRTADSANAASAADVKMEATPLETPGDSGVAGACKRGIATGHGSGSSNSTSKSVTLNAEDAAASLITSAEEFAQGTEPTGPVAALTTLGAAAGALKTAAEETMDVEAAPTDNANITTMNHKGDTGSGEGVVDVSAPLSDALSSVVPSSDSAPLKSVAVDASHDFSSPPPVSVELSAPAAAADFRAAGGQSEATNLTSSSAAPTRMTARSADDAAAPVRHVLSTEAGTKDAARVCAPTATPSRAVEARPTAAISSARTAKLSSTSTTARQRRRLRACKVGGGLCMREKCGCTALPPLLRLSCSTQELLQIALEASPNETLRELFDLGRADAFRWLVLEYMRCEDDLIRRRAAGAKMAHQQQQTPTESEGGDVPSTGSATCSRGATTSTSTSSLHTENSRSLIPALRQRWKSVSNRWGRLADSSNIKTSPCSSGDHHHTSCASTPAGGGGPALRPIKAQKYDKAVSDAAASPVTARPSPAATLAESASHEATYLPVQEAEGAQEKLFVKDQLSRRLRAPNATELLHSYIPEGAEAPIEAPLATAMEDRHVADNEAEGGVAPEVASNDQTTERCAGGPAAGNEADELEEARFFLKHAATAPDNYLTTPDPDGGATAPSPPPAVHPIAYPWPARAGSESFMMSAITQDQSERSKSRIVVAPTEEETDPAVRERRRDITPSPGAGADAHERAASDGAGGIQRNIDKLGAQRHEAVARQVRQAVEKKHYKEMLEKEVAGVTSGSDYRRRSAACASHAATRQRSISLPSGTVASPPTVCKRCRTSRVPAGSAVVGVCATCQSAMALLPGKPKANALPETAAPGRLLRERSSTCSETQADISRNGGAESGTPGGFLPALLLLKGASLSSRYAHIYTHSNLWNGDGARCMRPEEHTVGATVTTQTTKKITS